MPVIDLSPYKPIPATLGDANQIANGFQTVQNVLNAIDNLNFGAGRIFDPAKLMQNAAIDGDPLVWDNTLVKWVPASTLAAGRPRAPRVTVSTMAGGPPISPVDQDIWVATSVDAQLTRWMFQYNAGSASAFKWEFVGGNEAYIRPAIPAYVGAGGFTFTNSGLILARAGDYKVKIEGTAQNNGPVSPGAYSLAGGVGGVAVFTRQATDLIINGGNQDTAIWEDFGAGLAAATNLQVAFAGGGQPWNFNGVLVTALPTRVS